MEPLPLFGHPLSNLAHEVGGVHEGWQPIVMSWVHAADGCYIQALGPDLPMIAPDLKPRISDSPGLLTHLSSNRVDDWIHSLSFPHVRHRFRLGQQSACNCRLQGNQGGSDEPRAVLK